MKSLSNPYKEGNSDEKENVQALVSRNDFRYFRTISTHGMMGLVLQNFWFILCQELRANGIQSYDPDNDTRILNIINRLKSSGTNRSDGARRSVDKPHRPTNPPHERSRGVKKVRPGVQGSEAAAGAEAKTGNGGGGEG